MQSTRWFGVLSIAVPIAFVACGDEPEDAGSPSAGGTSGRGGSTGGTSGGASGTGNGGNAGAGIGGEAGEGGKAGEGGESGSGDAGGMGGEAGQAGAGQGGTSGNGGAMVAGGGAGGAVAGGGAGGAVAGGGAGGAVAGGGAGGAIAGGGAGGATAGGGAGGASAGAGGAIAGGGAGGAAGMAGGGMAGGAGFPTVCDPTPPPKVFGAVLSGTKENPPNTAWGSGWAAAELNAAETELTVSVNWQYLNSTPTSAHIHGPAPADMNAGIQFDLGSTPTDTTGGVTVQTFPINATQLADLKNGLYYANIHSTMWPDGEVRGQLVPALVFRSGPLSGLQEVPPNASTATGRVVVTVIPSDGLDPTAAVVSATWSGLNGNTVNVRLYGPADFGFIWGNVLDLEAPTGATSGTVVHKFWNFAGFDTYSLINNFHTYAEVRSVGVPDGEIRAQLLPPCPP